MFIVFTPYLYFSGQTYGGAVSFGDVQSANIVGYKTDGLVSGGFNMVAIPFASVDGGNVKLSDFTFENWLGGLDGFSGVDLVEIWDAENHGYKNYYWYNEEGCEEDWDWWNADETGTFDEQFPEGLPVGQAFWVEAAKDSAGREAPLKITFSGAVEDSDTVSYTLVSGGFNMIANPYPVAWSLSDDTTWVTENWLGGLDGFSGVDLVEIWDAENHGYKNYYWYNEEGCEEDWDWWNADETGTFDEQFPEGLAAAQPFWVEAAKDSAGRAEALKVTFLNPLKK